METSSYASESFIVVMSEKELSARDLSTLDLIFKDFRPNKNDLNDVPMNEDIDVKDQAEENSAEIALSKRLEIEGVILTEAGKLDDALLKFNESISIAKWRPSPLNNRAQLYRFLKKDDLALVDLTRSIELCCEKFPLTKCRAYCQHGAIKRKMGDIEEAVFSFNEASKLGSNFARQQIAELNPYSQLCNQMVSKLLSDLN